ncbi:hypothetical protein NL431_27720, partial [Klebsiella pneumoniae]|nr:hypothetical protein [Klebsiella pneumoniae]
MLLPLTALILPLGLGTPAAATESIDALVYKVRAEAAWEGVETTRIVRHGQMLEVFGHNRNGREVTLSLSCAELGFVCESR